MKKIFIALVALILTVPVFAQETTEIFEDNFYDTLNRGEYGLAEDLLSLWQQAGGDPIELKIAEAKLRMRSDSTATGAGEALFREAIASSPGRIDIHMSFMSELAKVGKTREAVEECREMFSEVDKNGTSFIYDHTIPADSVDIYIAAGMADLVDHLEGKISPEKLKELTEGIVSCRPGGIVEGMTRYQTGIVLYKKQRVNDVIEQWEKAVNIFDEPIRSELNLNLAILSMEKLDLEKAAYYATLAEKDGGETIQATAAKLLEELDKFSIPYRHYTMVLLSKLAHETTPSTEGEKVLLDPVAFNESLRQKGYNVDRDLSLISAVKVGKDSVNTIVWTMPDPKDYIDCLYVAFVPADSCYRFITLEKTFKLNGDDDEIFILCESVYQPETNRYAHSNFNMYYNRKTSAAKFGKIATDLVRKSKTSK